MFAAVSQESEDELGYNYTSKKVKIPETCSLYLLFYWNKLAFTKGLNQNSKCKILVFFLP